MQGITMMLKAEGRQLTPGILKLVGLGETRMLLE